MKYGPGRPDLTGPGRSGRAGLYPSRPVLVRRTSPSAPASAAAIFQLLEAGRPAHLAGNHRHLRTVPLVISLIVTSCATAASAPTSPAVIFFLYTCLQSVAGRLLAAPGRAVGWYVTSCLRHFKEPPASASRHHTEFRSKIIV